MANSLDIIIVNWNAGEQLRPCIDAIATADRHAVRVERTVVVDNTSTDGSVDTIGASDLNLVVLRNATNRGFAAACNQGAQGSTADYLLFLNPDTRIGRNALTDPIAFMEMDCNERVGIVGIQLVDSRGRVMPTCARFPTLGRFVTKMFGFDRVMPRTFPPHFMTEWDHGNTRSVDQVMGAFFLIRRLLFDALGGFDERFFVYFEEVDLALRARDRGWSTFYLSGVTSFHRGGGLTDQVKATRLFYSLRSRILYGFKHFGRWKGSLLMLASLFLEPLSRLAVAAARRSLTEMAETTQAYLRLFASIPRELVRDRLRKDT